MLKLIRLVTLSVFVLLLGACSIISDLIPEQEVELFATGNDTNTVESTTELLSEEPQSAEDLFTGSSTSLQSQAAGEKYIAINVMRKVTDLEVAAGLSDVTQPFSVSKIVLESATDASFPDELRASFGAPLFLMWDGFIAPEESTYFPFLPQERREALTASFVAASGKGLGVLINQKAFQMAPEFCILTSCFQGMTIEDQGIFYEKNSADCSESRCVYEFKGKVEYCIQEGKECSVYNVNDYLKTGLPLMATISNASLLTMSDILTQGESENTASLSVWLKVKSTSATPIPATATATTSLFLPPAKAKVDFGSN